MNNGHKYLEFGVITQDGFGANEVLVCFIDRRKTWYYVIFPSFSGLRSNNVGEQCEAIMKFPNLINQFPFPVLINTAFLKLADVFWSGYVCHISECFSQSMFVVIVFATL